MQRFRIDDDSYKPECAWCAMPLYVGDYAYVTLYAVVCSKGCGRAADEKASLRADALAAIDEAAGWPGSE
jgi:hypothetical protein